MKRLVSLPARGRKALLAVSMAFLILGVPVAAITGGFVPESFDPLMDPLRERLGGVEAPEGWPGGPLEDLLLDPMEGDDTLLRMLDHLGAAPREWGSIPIESHVLGASAPPEVLPALYEAEAVASGAPLQTALVAYNEALEFVDETELLRMPDFREADRLPVDAQVAIAVLLYAITDATMLQKQAVAGIAPEDYAGLLSIPGLITSGLLDPTDDSERADAYFNEAYRLLSMVDRDLIDQGAVIMVHAVSHAMPALRDWGREERAALERPDERLLEIRDLVEQYTPERIEQMDRLERLDILADTLRMAAAFQGSHVPAGLRALPPPDGEHPLRTAVLGFLDDLGVREAMEQEPLFLAELERADHLPHSMQLALARIVVNQADLVGAHLELQERTGDPGDLDAVLDGDALQGDPVDDALVGLVEQVRRAEVRVVRAVQESAPTLEAWGLYWAREPAMLPASPADLSGRLSDASALGAAMSHPDVTMQEIMRLAAHTKGARVDSVEEPPLPPRGALGDAVLDLYERYGIQVDAATRDQIARGAEALPPVVEQNTARVLLAQLDALGDLERLTRSLSEEDLVALEAGTWIEERLLNGGEISLRDVQEIRAHYEVRDRVEGTYLDAATKLAAALDASVGDLEAALGLTQSVKEEPDEKKPWYQQAWSTLTSIRFVGTASAQSAPGEPLQHPTPNCPAQSPLADCGNDVWFMDPLLETVVIAGFETTVFDPREMGAHVDLTALGDSWTDGVYPRGQMLTLDLGGDDVFMNNAGGASPPRTTTSSWNFAHPTAVAVALSLGGDNRYLPPPEDAFQSDNMDLGPNSTTVSAPGGVQGASIGGLGFLWDRRGNDRYEAEQDAQGFGSGSITTALLPPTATAHYGIGVLLSGDGNDRFRAENHAQGASSGLGLGVLVNLAGDDRYELTTDEVVCGSGPNAPRLPAVGQGGSMNLGSVGILVDAAGDDRYVGGMQGDSCSGLGVLVDLEGEDSYDHGERRDGRCKSFLRVPGGDALNDPDGFQANATAMVLQERHFFVDLEDGRCDAPLPILPDVDQWLEDNVGDSDGDGYPDIVEETIGTDSSDGEDYPAGLPKDAPPGWPDGIDYPPGGVAGQDLPHGSAYLVRIPGVFALGDAVDTVYPRCGWGDWESRLGVNVVPGVWQQNCVYGDYVLSVDLGGNNTYHNRPGSTILVIDGTRDLELPGLTVDIQGDDLYDSDQECSLGCNGFLLDLGGNDTYVGPDRTQGVAVASIPTEPSETTTGGVKTGVLFDADGDDSFTVTKPGAKFAQGSADAGDLLSVPLTGILLAVGGDDTFSSPVQGVVDSPAAGGVPQGGVGLFLNMGGNDTYQGVGRQGVVVSNNPGYGFAAFVDVGGDDRYVGSPGSPDHPEMGWYYNDRMEASASAAGTSLFWDTAMDDAGNLARTVDAAGDDNRTGQFRLGALGVYIGSADTDLYTQPATLLLDPGGEDVYRNNAGGTVFRMALEATADEDDSEVHAVYDADRNYPLAALSINLEGDNRYEPAGGDPDDPWSLLADRAGGILTQGAGFLGTGVLVDDQGDDTYVARAMSQGFGLFGWGILWDKHGDDTYRYDQELVRRPALHDGLAVWTEYVMQRDDPLEGEREQVEDEWSEIMGVGVNTLWQLTLTLLAWIFAKVMGIKPQSTHRG